MSEEDELSCIGTGLTSLSKLKIGPNLQVLNLHANRITRIDNLTSAFNLVHLDLSSNTIINIEGLEFVPHLRTLNLSCNKIRRVRGLGKLHNLVKIDLSYNVIEDVEGFCEMHGNSYSINSIDISGNLLSSLDLVRRCLIGCINLQSLTVAHDVESHPNKFCCIKGYVGKLFSFLPMLHNINGRDRNGNPVPTIASIADIPVLDELAEYFYSSDCSSRPIQSTDYSKAHVTFSDKQVAFHDNKKVPLENRRSNFGSEVNEKRIAALEHQISKLVNREEETSTERRSVRESNTRSDDDEPTRDDAGFSEQSRKVSSDEQSEIRPNNQRKSAVVKRRVTKPVVKKPLQTSTHSETSQTSQGRVSVEISDEKDLNSNETAKNLLLGDASRRTEIKSTYIQLMKQLEVEKERRWKAEQAAKKLADAVRVNVNRLKEEQDHQTSNEETIKELKEALAREREITLAVEAERDRLEEQVEELSEAFSSEKTLQEELNAALKDKEDFVKELEQEYQKQENLLVQKCQESQLKATVQFRELELVRAQVETLKSKLEQMQELLANREQKHVRDLEGRFMLNSKEFQDQVQLALNQHGRDHKELVDSLKRECHTADRKYKELEDEFRVALHTESDRYNELITSYYLIKTENDKSTQAVAVLSRKDTESRALIADLNSMVKELKGRLVEVSRSKHEQGAEWRERVQQLEMNLDEARNRMIQFELMKKEKVKLVAEISARESLIEGMKSEKKLWGDELARQSSSLAQDRGRLEAKIETLETEIVSVKQMLESETDSVRIKTRIIEDQNDTVRKLKDGVTERDVVIKNLREELLTNQKLYDEQLSCEIEENKKQAERLSREQERKIELKEEIVRLNEAMTESDGLVKGLKERLKCYEELEDQVTGMKAEWDERERELERECKEAKQTAAAATDRIKELDTAFRAQLDAKEAGHQSALAELRSVKQSEIEREKERVREVEREMREILKESERIKRVTELRLKKLTDAFSDLNTQIET